jgi:hypothetical protein
MKQKTVKQRTILDSMDDPRLFAKTFKRRLFQKDSWAAWKVFLSALFGLPMDKVQREIFYKHTHRRDIPSKPFREAFLVCGRRAGKSIVSALCAVFCACFVDHSDVLAPGERGTVMILSSDRAQAKIIYGYILGFLESPLLKGMVQGEPRKESIDLSNGITIQIQTASFRAVRGFSIVAAICDEIAFWADFDRSGSNPDSAVLEALRPAMLTIPRALLLCVSSPYAMRGELWRNYNLHYGQVSDTLVWQGDSASMNPCLPASEIAKAYAKDAVCAASEFGAQFREATTDFISLAMIAARTSEGVSERPYRDDHRYYAFCDSSGGKGDSAVLAVGHFEHKDKQAVLDALREIESPHSPQHACAEFAAILKGFHIHEIILDRFATSFVAEHFERAGISYRASEFSRSQLYIKLLPQLNSGTVVLLDHKRMAQQFAGLVRSCGRNADAVDHRSGQHDDCANATAGCLVEIFKDNQEGSLGLLEFERQISSGARRDHSAEPPWKRAKTRSEAPRPQDGVPDPCPLCGQRRVWMSAGIDRLVAHCNQDGSDDGVVPVTGAEFCPNLGVPHSMTQWAGGKPRCAACGWQPGRAVVLGATFKDLKASQRSAFNGLFDSLRHR